jgi:hypothetical protein
MTTQGKEVRISHNKSKVKESIGLCLKEKIVICKDRWNEVKRL